MSEVYYGDSEIFIFAKINKIRILFVAPNISAFMAYSSIDTSSSPMKYNKELLDTTSSFMSPYYKAPEDGVYLFFWNMHANNIRLESFLQVNDTTVGQTIGDATSADYEGSSNLAILRLRKNDRE